MEKKINLLITLVDLHFGGISNLILQTSPELARKFNVSIVYFGPKEDMLERFKDAEINISRIKYNGKKDTFTAVKHLKQYIKNNNIKIVLTNFVLDKFLISLTRMTTEFKIVGTIHNSFNPEITKKKQSVRGRFEEFFHNNIADKVVAVSDAAVKMAKKFRNLSNRNIVVVYSGIAGLSNCLIKKQKNPKTIFMTACRFVEIKGLSRLINRFHLLNKKNDNWELWLIGDGKLMESLKIQVEESDLEDKIIFQGYHKELKPFFQSADFYVNSSFNEALSVSILEAMSMSLPILASNVGGNPELVKDGYNGLLIDFEKEEESVESLRRALEMKNESYSDFSTESFNVFKSKYSIERYVEKLSAELKEMVSHYKPF